MFMIGIGINVVVVLLLLGILSKLDAIGKAIEALAEQSVAPEHPALLPPPETGDAP